MLVLHFVSVDRVLKKKKILQKNWKAQKSYNSQFLFLELNFAAGFVSLA